MDEENLSETDEEMLDTMEKAERQGDKDYKPEPEEESEDEVDKEIEDDDEAACAEAYQRNMIVDGPRKRRRKSTGSSERARIMSAEEAKVAIVKRNPKRASEPFDKNHVYVNAKGEPQPNRAPPKRKNKRKKTTSADDDEILEPQVQKRSRKLPQYAGEKAVTKALSDEKDENTSNNHQGVDAVPDKDDRFEKDHIIRLGATLWEIVVPGQAIIGAPYKSKAEWATLKQEHIFRCKRINKAGQTAWKFFAVFLSQHEKDWTRELPKETPIALSFTICEYVYPGITKAEDSNAMSWKKIQEQKNIEVISGESVPMLPPEYYQKCQSTDLSPAQQQIIALKRNRTSIDKESAKSYVNRLLEARKEDAKGADQGKGKTSTLATAVKDVFGFDDEFLVSATKRFLERKNGQTVAAANSEGKQQEAPLPSQPVAEAPALIQPSLPVVVAPPPAVKALPPPPPVVVATPESMRPTDLPTQEYTDFTPWLYIARIYEALLETKEFDAHENFPLLFEPPLKCNALHGDVFYLDLASNTINQTLKLTDLLKKFGETQCYHMFAVVNRVAKFAQPHLTDKENLVRLKKLIAELAAAEAKALATKPPEKDTKEPSVQTECPICFEVFSGTVFWCPFGHGVCAECYKKLKPPHAEAKYKCPYGGCEEYMPKEPIHSVAKEKILDKMRFPCEHGCGAKLTRQEKHKHEALGDCKILVHCPFVAHTACDWKASCSILKDHLCVQHKTELLHTAGSPIDMIYRFMVPGLHRPDLYSSIWKDVDDRELPLFFLVDNRHPSRIQFMVCCLSSKAPKQFFKFECTSPTKNVYCEGQLLPHGGLPTGFFSLDREQAKKLSIIYCSPAEDLANTRNFNQALLGRYQVVSDDKPWLEPEERYPQRLWDQVLQETHSTDPADWKARDKKPGEKFEFPAWTV